MALERGTYGIEYHPRPGDSSGHGWILWAIAALACLSLVVTLVGRWRRGDDAQVKGTLEASEPRPQARESAPKPAPAVKVVSAPASVPSRKTARSPKLVNLLVRLENSERNRDVEMAVSTIETIRSLPAEQIADIDDGLAKRLGDLNLKRLFVLKSRQWVEEVTVRSGDSATRIAREHASTVASMEKLNGPGSTARIFAGRKMLVMNHPNFRLEIRRGGTAADLYLRGKFFRRYRLVRAAEAAVGEYRAEPRVRALFSELELEFARRDREELEMLMPAESTVRISE